MHPKQRRIPGALPDMKTTEERLQVVLWYPFSLRSLIQIDGRWFEEAVCSSRDRAYHLMKASVAQNRDRYSIVVQCTQQSKEGREKAILFSPIARQVKDTPAKTLRKDTKDI